MDAQYKKGVLDLCVLSQLVEEDKYGYQLTEETEDSGETAQVEK